MRMPIFQYSLWELIKRLFNCKNIIIKKYTPDKDNPVNPLWLV